MSVSRQTWNTQRLKPKRTRGTPLNQSARRRGATRESPLSRAESAAVRCPRNSGIDDVEWTKRLLPTRREKRLLVYESRANAKGRDGCPGCARGTTRRNPMEEKGHTEQRLGDDTLTSTSTSANHRSAALPIPKDPLTMSGESETTKVRVRLKEENQLPCSRTRRRELTVTCSGKSSAVMLHRVEKRTPKPKGPIPTNLAEERTPRNEIRPSSNR